MAVRSRSLALLAQLPAGQTVTLYTVPAGRTAIVRWASVVNRCNGAPVVRLRVRSASGAAVDVWSGTVQHEAGALMVDGDLVLSPGYSLEAIRTAAGTTDSIMFFVAGSLLDGEPE